MAADGNRVAVATGVCGNRIVIWTAPGRRSTTVTTARCTPSGLAPFRVRELALGDGQVAWIGDKLGTYEYRVLTAPLSGGAPIRIEATSHDPANYDEGGWVGHLLGGGPLLAYNRWTIVCNPDCPPARLTGQRLVRITAGRRMVVKSGADGYPLTAVGGGRMAVTATANVTVFDAAGSPLATVSTIANDPPRAVVLNRTWLALERKLTLDLFDPATGAETKSLPLRSAATFTLGGVNARLALLHDDGTGFTEAGPRHLVLIRLSDGKVIPLALPRENGYAPDARLTDVGLFYTYTDRVAFEPTAKLLARF
jgi:hypothetical protein